jgi:tetratricopeptide (TPR) repeat protein
MSVKEHSSMTIDPLLRYEGDFVPELQADIDLASVQMGAEERFLFSRIDGRTTVRQLSSLLGAPPVRVARGLLRLEVQGVIGRPAGLATLSDDEIQALSDTADEEPQSEVPTQVAKRVNTVHEADLIGVGRYAGTIFPREPFEEINDLPVSLRKELIWCDLKADTIDAFKVFDVSANADARSARKAVNNKLRMFHPDTYFDHELGSFGPIIMRHSVRLGKLAEIMLDDSAREELRGKLTASGALKEELDSEGIAEKARLDRAMKARRMRKNPMFRRMAQAKEIFAEAMLAAEQKKFVKAYNSIMTASSFDPANPTYIEMAERFKRRAADERVERHIKAADFNQGIGRWDRAAGAWIYAAKNAPHRPEYWANAAGMLLRVGEDLKLASEMIDKALEVEPQNPSFLRIQMNIFDAADMSAKAARVAERILEIDPTAADVAERLKKGRRKN